MEQLGRLAQRETQFYARIDQQPAFGVQRGESLAQEPGALLGEDPGVRSGGRRRDQKLRE
jgi:hypothetical protein